MNHEIDSDELFSLKTAWKRKLLIVDAEIRIQTLKENQSSIEL